MDTRKSMFYENKRVVADSAVPTCHLVLPDTCKNSAEQSLSFYLMILEVIMSALLQETVTQSLNRREADCKHERMRCRSSETSWFPDLGRQTELGRMFSRLSALAWPTARAQPCVLRRVQGGQLCSIPGLDASLQM